MMFYENGKLNFNTQLTQFRFTKARFSDRLNEQGLLAEKNGEDWNFSPYEFSGTYEKDNYVFLEGNGFAGRELSELISSEQKETRVYSLSFMITLLEKMVSKKVSGFNAEPASVFVSAVLKNKAGRKITFEKSSLTKTEAGAALKPDTFLETIFSRRVIINESE